MTDSTAPDAPPDGPGDALGDAQPGAIVDGCYSCRMTADPGAPASERVARTTYWRVAHAFDASLPGWLVLVAVPHLAGLADLAPEAGTELGDLVRRLSVALERVVGCAKTYLMQFSEATGFSHLHLHLVPRMPDQPEDRRGPRIFGYLGAAEADRVPAADRDRIATELAAILATIP